MSVFNIQNQANVAQLVKSNNQAKANNSNCNFVGCMAALVKSEANNSLAIAQGGSKSELDFLREKEEKIEFDDGIRTLDDALSDLKKVIMALSEEFDS